MKRTVGPRPEDNGKAGKGREELQPQAPKSGMEVPSSPTLALAAAPAPRLGPTLHVWEYLTELREAQMPARSGAISFSGEAAAVTVERTAGWAPWSSLLSLKMEEEAESSHLETVLTSLQRKLLPQTEQCFPVGFSEPRQSISYGCERPAPSGRPWGGGAFCPKGPVIVPKAHFHRRQVGPRRGRTGGRWLHLPAPRPHLGTLAPTLPAIPRPTEPQIRPDF